MNPKVYIIILNYNGWTDTIECLESVLRNDYPNYQVIVVDNNSPNNSMEYIKAWAEGKLNAWVNPNNPLRKLSSPPVSKSIPYVFIQRKGQKKGGNPEFEESLKENIPDGIKYTLMGYKGGLALGNHITIKHATAESDFNSTTLLNIDNLTIVKHSIYRNFTMEVRRWKEELKNVTSL
jgi:GT2 family glycosyltransferase